MVHVLASAGAGARCAASSEPEGHALRSTNAVARCEYWCDVQGVKLRNEALRKFQLRVLSLIEIWAKKEPASPLAALVPVPLLRALRIASRPSGHPPLAQRLEHVLKHQVARCRPVFAPSLAVDGLAAAEEAEEGGTASKTGLEQVMSRVMYFATRESDEKVLKAATAAYTMLLRGLIAAAQRGAAAGDNPAQAALHAAVAAIAEEVFDKRKSRWSYENVAGMLTAAQDTLPVLLLPALLEKVVKPRTEFLRIEALRLCAVCLRCAPVLAEQRVGSCMWSGSKFDPRNGSRECLIVSCYFAVLCICVAQSSVMMTSLQRGLQRRKDVSPYAAVPMWVFCKPAEGVSACYLCVGGRQIERRCIIGDYGRVEGALGDVGVLLLQDRSSAVARVPGSED